MRLRIVLCDEHLCIVQCVQHDEHMDDITTYIHTHIPTYIYTCIVTVSLSYVSPEFRAYSG